MAALVGIVMGDDSIYPVTRQRRRSAADLG